MQKIKNNAIWLQRENPRREKLTKDLPPTLKEIDPLYRIEVYNRIDPNLIATPSRTY